MHLDAQGIDRMIEILNSLRGKGNADVHLFTPEWGGEDLSEEPQNESLAVMNHLKIMAWNA